MLRILISLLTTLSMIHASWAGTMNAYKRAAMDGAKKVQNVKRVVDFYNAFRSDFSAKDQKFLRKKFKGGEATPMSVKVVSTYKWKVKMGKKSHILHLPTKNKPWVSVNKQKIKFNKGDSIQKNFRSIENQLKALKADSRSLLFPEAEAIDFGVFALIAIVFAALVFSNKSSAGDKDPPPPPAPVDCNPVNAAHNNCNSTSDTANKAKALLRLQEGTVILRERKEKKYFKCENFQELEECLINVCALGADEMIVGKLSLEDQKYWKNNACPHFPAVLINTPETQLELDFERGEKRSTP